MHPEFRSNRIEFVQPVGIPRENTKSDTTRAGVKIRPPSQCLATCTVPPLPLSLPPSPSLYLTLSLSLFLSFLSLHLSLHSFFSLVLFRSLLPCISISSVTFLILFFPPPFHPFSPLSFFPALRSPFFRSISFHPSTSLIVSLSFTFSLSLFLYGEY